MLPRLRAQQKQALMACMQYAHTHILTNHVSQGTGEAGLNGEAGFDGEEGHDGGDGKVSLICICV